MKKTGIIIIGCLLLWTTVNCFIDCTLVIPVSSYRSTNLPLKVGDKVNFFNNFDFSKGHWSAYIVLNRYDYKDLDPAIKKAGCLKTTDISLLQKMKQQWNFVYTGADMATVQSAIYIFRDNKLVFESGIVLDKVNQGLQSEMAGFTHTEKPNALTESCAAFKKVYWPVVIL
jgi:hypothetical protein